MQKPALPEDEHRRLAALAGLGVLDTEPEARYERIVRLAARHFRVPIALLSLVDADRQWFKAAYGLNVRQTSRDVSFCGHAILGSDAFVVEDARSDARFRDNPLVAGAPHIGFYAGQPLAGPDGSRVGTLCIMDHKPRTLSAADLEALRDFARLAENELSNARVHRALEFSRESQALRSAILATALDCIISIDDEGRVVEFNPAAELTFGYSRQDVVGKELASLIIPEKLRESHRRGLKRFLATGEGPVIGKRVEVEAMRADGSGFPAELAITPTYIGGKPTFTAYLRDISARKIGEQRLAIQYAVASAFAETSRLEDAFERVIEAVCSNLGWSVGALWLARAGADELTCAHVWQRPDTDLEEFVAATRTGTFRRGVGLPGRVLASGSPAWIQDVEADQNFPRIRFARKADLHTAIGFPLRAGGRLLGVFEFFTRRVEEPDDDLLRALEAVGSQAGQFIERMLDEEKLRRLTGELDAIFNLSPDGFLAFDRHGLTTYVNKSLLSMLDMGREGLTRLTEDQVDDLLLAMCDPREPYSRCSTARDGASDVLRLVRPRPKTLLRSVKLLVTAAHERLGKVLYFRDVTGEAEVDRMKTEFLSTAAHELRTPMASIHGFTELLLRRDYDAKTQRELLQTIHRQSTKLNHLVNELLDLARIEARAGKDFKIRVQPLLPIVRQTVREFMVPDDPRKVSLRLGRGSPLVAVDGEKFSQALLNVLSNAYKYSPDGGAVVLRTVARAGEHGREIGISVADRGIGMAPEVTSRIFERFYRADAAGAFPGTGLGLSLVKEIMDIHRGAVEVKSVPGSGTEVTLWLAEKPGPVPAGEGA